MFPKSTLLPSPSVPGKLGAQPVAPAPAPNSNPLDNFFFAVALALIFIRVSMVHMILTYKLGAESYILYVFGLPAVLGIIAKGGIWIVLRRKAGVLWILFGLWLLIAVPFSIWHGGSVMVVTTYLRTDLIMLLVAGGLVKSWKQFRIVMITVAVAAVVNLISARIFGQVDMNGRTGLEFGMLANPNDFAGHMLLVLPFLLWVALTKRFFVWRLLAVIAVSYGLFMVLATASRGAAVALVAGLVFYVFATSQLQRMVVLLLCPVLLIGSVALLPSRAWDRILSFSVEKGTEEAIESSNSREYLLKKSIEYTIKHPVFGVGAGQFSSFEGKSSRQVGSLGSWHDTHNSFTQISSENGIPALLFFTGGIMSTFLLFSRVQKLSKQQPELNEVATTAMCLRLSMVTFCTAIVFLNFGYFFYLPMMAGLGISFIDILEGELLVRKSPGRVHSTVPYAPVTPSVIETVATPAKSKIRFNKERV